MENKIKKWLVEHNYKLIIFNIIIVFLFLLRSAGYFQPYFTISVNFIVIFALVISVLLLNANSKVIFVAVLIFWTFAGLLQLLQISVWADRTGIYAYESLIFGVLLFLFENIKKNNILKNIVSKVIKMPILKLIGL